MRHIQTHALTRPAQYRALLFICLLFMLIILLPWIHPVTDQRPTSIATNISYCFMATAPILYSRMTHAASVVVCVNRLQTRSVQESGMMAPVQRCYMQSFTRGAQSDDGTKVSL